MFHKIEKITALDNYILHIFFKDGTEVLYDVKPLFIKWKSFLSLTVIDGLFYQVKVDVGGFGIYWNDELDLSCDELYENGKVIEHS